MNLKTATIADLKPHPDNPNTHPPAQIEALVDSLTEFTQVKNVVIWNDRIIAGHGVVEAAKRAGLLTLEVNDISHWPEEKATAFMLADIRLPDMGFIDDEAMVEALRAIDEPLDIPGFDEDYLAGLPGFGDGDEPPGNANVENFNSQFLIIIECDNEDDQISKLEQLTEQGYICRALVS